MATLNNTPIRSVVPLHLTNKTLWIIFGITLWTIFTSSVTYLAIYKNIHPVVECESAELMKPVFYEDKRSQQLIKNVQDVFSVDKEKAKKIVDLAEAHTDGRQFPSATLVIAIMSVESSFREAVTSKAGAKGLMQVLPMNSSGKDSFSNVYDAVKLLREYKEESGSVDATLHMYNVGPKNYAKGQRVPEYVNKIKETQRKLLRLSEVRV